MSDKPQPDGIGSPHYVAYLLMKQVQEDMNFRQQYEPMTKDQTLDLYVECYKAAWGNRPSKN